MKRITTLLVLIVGMIGCVATAPKVSSLDGFSGGKFSFEGIDNYWKGKTSDLSGELTFPSTPSSDPVPTVMILHGSAGPGYRSDNWASFLNDHGYATLKLDYYSHRGINQGRRDGPASSGDVYSALNILSTHPNVDKTKIAILGFSRGGSITLMSTMYSPAYTAGINPAAFIAFYPGCERISVDKNAPDVPIAVMIGDKDSLANLPACQALADGGDRYGKNVQLYVYEGGYHGFDDNVARTINWGGSSVRMQPDAKIKAQSREDVLKVLQEAFSR